MMVLKMVQEPLYRRTLGGTNIESGLLKFVFLYLLQLGHFLLNVG